MKISKSGTKKDENCPKMFFYAYYMYPDDRSDVGIEAIEGTDFHEYGEVFDDNAFYDKKRGDNKYWESRPKSVVRIEFANQYIQFLTKRRDSMTREEFVPFAKEIYIELDDIRGFIDYLSPVYTKGILTGMSLGEIKPSRKNHSPKYLRDEMAFYYILLSRGLKEGGISEYYFNPVTNDYKRDEYGEPIPYPYTVPTDLPITHWEAYYYKEPLETAHWFEKIGKCGLTKIEQLYPKIKFIVDRVKNGGRFPVWTRDNRRQWFSNPLCPVWCDYAVFCNPYYDGFVCNKCGAIELLHYDFVHLCNRK